MSIKLDILAIAAHPDDAEISAGGTLLRSIAQGKKVGIVDLTRGEMGTRGSGDLRMVEAANAANVLGLSVRSNLGLADCFFEYDQQSLLKIIEKIREFRPSIVLANSFSDRHPDHARASKLISDACFYSGLRKIDTGQDAWRPNAVYHYNQDFYNKPDFVVDVTEYWEKKEEALRCYASQFYDPNSTEPTTPIAGKEFFDFLRARSMDFGRPSGYLYAEGFMVERTMGVRDLFDLD